jgi:uncharacterized damage-inducible protein DinB
MALELYMELGSKDHQAGSVLAWMLAYPGCVSFGNSQQDAVERAPLAARAYVDWLRGHGQAHWIPIDVDPQPVEIFQVAFQGDYEINAIFSADFGQIANSYMQECLRWLEWASNDLLLSVVHLRPEVLDAKPVETTMSIRDIVRHVERAQRWLASRLEISPQPLPPPDPQENVFEKFKATLTDTLNNLAKFPPENAKIILTHSGEVWTIKKVLRRLLYHSTYHRRQVERRLKAMVTGTDV